MDAILDSPLTHQDHEPTLVEQLRGSYYRVGQALASSLNLEETLRLIVEATAEITGASAATVHLRGEEGKRLILKGSAGPAQAALARLQLLQNEPLSEEVVRHRQAVQIPDLTTDERMSREPSASDLSANEMTLLKETDSKNDLRSYLAVPLMLRSQVMGVLAIARETPGHFTTSEVELLQSFASQAAVAIENTRLFSALQDKLREVTGLYEVSRAFGALPRLEDTYDELAGRIARLLDIERCAILLPDEAGQYMVAQPQAYGLTAEQIDSLRLPLFENTASSRVWSTGKPYLTNDAQSDPRNVHTFTQAFSDRSMLIVPMIVEGEPIGLLRASNKRSGRFSHGDMRLLTIFATQAAVILKNAMLYREVARERGRLKAIVDNASDGIAIIDRERRIIAFNPAMEALTGWKADEAIGANCGEVYQNHNDKGCSLCDSACPIVNLISRNSDTPYIETIMTTRSGKERDIAVSYSPIAPNATPDDPSFGQVVAIVRDVSRSKEIERQKTQFVSTVSHELRTPLASIKASVGVLLASMPEETSDPIMKLLRNIDRSSQRLESIVLDLLDLSRLQSGRVKLSLRQVDLVEVASEAISTVRPLTDGKKQTIELLVSGSQVNRLTRKPILTGADKQRLGQVILNLLSNAHKYSPEGATITLKLTKRPNEVVCGVIDQGPGIPEEEQKLIFERFYRPDNAVTQLNAGTGLGLPIARALIELHGGRMWVRSQLGKGSTFFFAIPRNPGAEEVTHK